MKDKNAEYKDWLERKRLALFLRTLRKFEGFSKKELAEKAGYESESIITAIENASKAPDYERVVDLANALDVSIEQLRGYGKIKVSDKGYASLSESERIALFLLAPVIKELKDEDIRYLMDTALLLVRARGVKPKWKQTKYQKDKTKEKDEK